MKRDPQRLDYMDTALTPVTDDDQETLELFHETRPSVRPPSVVAVQ